MYKKFLENMVNDLVFDLVTWAENEIHNDKEAAEKNKNIYRTEVDFFSLNLTGEQETELLKTIFKKAIRQFKKYHEKEFPDYMVNETFKTLFYC